MFFTRASLLRKIYLELALLVFLDSFLTSEDKRKFMSLNPHFYHIIDQKIFKLKLNFTFTPLRTSAHVFFSFVFMGFLRLRSIWVRVLWCLSSPPQTLFRGPDDVR